MAMAELVIVDHKELLEDTSSSLQSKIEQAYGLGSLGILAIRNVPDFCNLKDALLPLSHSLNHLPESYLKETLEDFPSLYNAGYSFGKEKLGNAPDTSKASFYFNPLTDQPGTAEDRGKYPYSYPCNKWPTEKLPDLEPACKSLGRVMKNVVVELSKHIDALAKSKAPSYQEGQLYNAMKSTEKAKGRLLYYFPIDTSSNKEDSWIGWHNDSGFLTALAGDLYVHHETGQVLENPDPNAGLYVVTRDNMVLKVEIPSDCMAVQIGECVQILTGGAVVATPHCVRGASSGTLARISLPVFVDTPPTFGLHVPSGCSRDDAISALECPRVPPLASRWTEDGMTFGDFLTKTFETYYEWSSK